MTAITIDTIMLRAMIATINIDLLLLMVSISTDVITKYQRTATKKQEGSKNTDDYVNKQTPWLSVIKRTIPIEIPPRPAKYCHHLRVEDVVLSVQQIPTAVNLSFLDRSGYLSFQIAPQLSSRGRMALVTDYLLLRLRLFW
jgi:hypothetical protein